MTPKNIDQDQRDAVAIILTHCAAELATVIAMHERGCFLRAALEICLGMAGMTKDQLIEKWVEQAMTNE
jgi:hypothetical protein